MTYERQRKEVRVRMRERDERPWREKIHKILIYFFTIDLQCDSKFRIRTVAQLFFFFFFCNSACLKHLMECTFWASIVK